MLTVRISFSFRTESCEIKENSLFFSRDIILSEFKLVYFALFTGVWRNGLPLLSARRKSDFEKRPGSSALNVFSTIASFVLLCALRYSFNK